jgi:hypothetical protein
MYILTPSLGFPSRSVWAVAALIVSGKEGLELFKQHRKLFAVALLSTNPQLEFRAILIGKSRRLDVNFHVRKKLSHQWHMSFCKSLTVVAIVLTALTMQPFVSCD